MKEQASSAISSFSATPVLLLTLSLVVVVNILIRKLTKNDQNNSVGFKRDVNNSFQNPITDSVAILSNGDSVLKRDGVQGSIDGYESLFNGARKNVGTTSSNDSIRMREREYKEMVASFYDLVTDFYEWGWGQSFHFAPRFVGETFDESIKRTEYYIAHRAGVTHTSKALDVGCGVGGPMRNIQQFTGADITGVTINDYQVRVGNQYCSQKGIADKCRIVKGDFQKLAENFEEGSFDAAYAIEATCHSPNRVDCFKGVHHTLKKGGYFSGVDWVVLPESGYDGKNPDHVRIKEGIEVGNSLPTLATPDGVINALEDAGFEVIEYFDLNRNVHSEQEIPWYQTLQGSMLSLSGFRMSRIGRICTHGLVMLLEALRIAPHGAKKVSSLLNATALDLVEGGEKEIFTPSFFFLAKKK